MKITKKLLQNKNACKEGYEWFLEQKTTDAFEIFNRLVKENKLDWFNWILTKLMTKEECVRYAVYAAELKLKICKYGINLLKNRK